MKKHHWTIGLAIVFILILFVIFIARPRFANAPDHITNQLSETVVIPLSIVSIKENSSSSPTISIEYPQFTSLDTLNKAISSVVMDRLAEFKKDASENKVARLATSDPKANIPDDAYSFITDWQQTQINNHYISLVIRFDSYTGGANEIQELQTFNYDLYTHKIMTLSDLFPNKTNYLDTISTLSRTQLIDSLKAASNGDIQIDMLNSGTEPLIVNFQNFTFNDYSITFYFPKYAVAPGSFGEQHVSIPKSAIK